MKRNGDGKPLGFQGPVGGWGALVPPGDRRLQLPRERATWRASAGPFDVIEAQAWTESLGRIEEALPQLASKLADGGTLLLDIDNIQSAAMLRLVVEGRPGQFDPAGNADDPTLPVALRRAVQAAAVAGLVVTDVVRVPAPAAEFPESLAKALFQNGLLPLDWLQGPPPARHWLVCRKVATAPGSILIAGGDAAARERTAAAVAAFVPAEWQILVADDVSERAGWNRAVAAATGDVLWFLRGGALPTAATFRAMAARAIVGPVAPAQGGERCMPGDLCGLMLPRADALLAGPVDERVVNTRVALEDHLMRLEAATPLMTCVDTPFEAPTAPIEQPALLAEETAELVASWAAIQPGSSTPASSSPAPQAAAAAPTRAPAPWAGRAPRVSLCMIAKNEQRFLGECLARAKDAVDEIVLVDTGSTDETVAIAESFGARVLRAPWQDDFSSPRNVGLQAATGDWILVLDADEFLQPGACERIRAAVQDPNVLGYHMHFVNVYGDGKTLGVMMVRLFRNLPGIHYQNVIHEQVTPSLQRIGQPLGLTLASAEIEVEHHGYSDAVMNERGKNERNERLFKKQLEATPDDVYCLYKYGDFLRRVPGRGADARALLDRCLDRILAGSPSLPRELPYASEVASLCALEAARAGDTTRAREALEVALRRFVPTPNLHYMSASLALADGRAEEAIHHYRRCLAYRGQVLVVPIQEGITGHVSLVGIAQAWLLRGRHDRAKALLEQAIALEPAYEVAHLALSKLLLLAGDVGGAMTTLTQFLAAHPESPGACQQLALILQRIGQKDAAQRIGRRAVQLLEARSLDHEAKAMDRLLAAT
jgi:tetratricopeptide (TPR) repeat protein